MLKADEYEQSRKQPEFDMFSAASKPKVTFAAASQAQSSSAVAPAATAAQSTAPTEDTSIMWEYKWADQQVFGPFSGTRMMVWRDQGFFDQAFVRRVKPEVSDWFKPSRQTDFLSSGR